MQKAIFRADIRPLTAVVLSVPEAGRIEGRVIAGEGLKVVAEIR